MSDTPDLPDFTRAQFDLTDPPECDLILKGGITSGVVYPYAILQIATKYRLRSIGGTSAGAIAAAFAAAAEYGRQHGRPEAFVTLKTYCDALPELLPGLFQPDPAFDPALDMARQVKTSGSLAPILRCALRPAFPGAVMAALAAGALSSHLAPGVYPTTLAALLGGVCGGALAVWSRGRSMIEALFRQPLNRLQQEGFGLCSGLTRSDSSTPALTDWLHRALQHIAFGDPDHSKPLTFGDLQGRRIEEDSPDIPAINLRIMTTNLSMRRPHTLPWLGVSAGFRPEDWAKIFPAPVMSYLTGKTARGWEPEIDTLAFPRPEALPVLVAVRMSLSFPVLFSTVRLRMQDTEHAAIMAKLGGTPEKPIRTVHLSDGGLSSNFPIHLFDAPLPSRPTFAFSLESLPCDPSKVKRRVFLPDKALDGIGVQIDPIEDLGGFGWQVIDSAKDWQDQLLAEITGQRERIVRIFLAPHEGGLNLKMPASVSRALMRYGYEAGRAFTGGNRPDEPGFDFDEHRWRRFLALSKTLGPYLDRIDRTWNDGFRAWFAGHAKGFESYRKLTKADRAVLVDELEAMLKTRKAQPSDAIKGRDRKLPAKSGMLRIGAKR